VPVEISSESGSADRKRRQSCNAQLGESCRN
jgi:hypothetical protein